MKKILYFAAALVMLVLGTSCEKGLTTFTYEEGVAGVTFPSDVQIFNMLAEDGNKIQVEMVRGNVNGAVSIPVEITDYTDGVFTPEKSTFDFADGEASAFLTFTYPSLENFGGETYQIDIEITDEKALEQLAMTGIEAVTVQAKRQLTEVSLGEGYFYDYILYEDEWDQEICTTVEAPDLFYLKSCFEKGVNINFTAKNGVFTIDETVDTGCLYSASYGNFAIRQANIAYDAENNALILSGILCLPSIEYDFCEYYGAFILPEGFDVNKYFGI